MTATDERAATGERAAAGFGGASGPPGDGGVAAAGAEEGDGRPSLLERLLDPGSIRLLMGSGGGILVAGLVLWLWAVGVFENPAVAAATLGGANLALLGGGVWLGRRTRYETAGRGLALLAAALMPLNLWFYDAQGLIVLEEGGPLWLPATAICLLTVAGGYLLRDPNFAYAVVGGVTMTGLLILADQRVDRFFEVVAPATLLTALGLAAIHAERVFADVSGPFGRKRFGRAFFRAGQVVLTAGLLVLLGGRLSGLLAGHEIPFATPWGGFVPTDVATVTSLKFAALGLIAAGAYGFAYSHAAVERSGRSLTLAMLCGLWGAFVTADVAGLTLSPRVGLGIVATAGFATLLPGRVFERRGSVLGGTVRPIGDGLVTLAGLGTLLLTINTVAAGSAAFGDVPFLLGMLSLVGVASACSVGGWRRSHLSLAATLGCAAAVVVHVTSPLTLPQRVELIAVLLGLPVLAASHAGWWRERAVDRDGEVTLGLWVGSFLVAAPLTIGLLLNRLLTESGGGAWLAGHEPVALAAALALLGSGCLCRVRATTLTGAAMTAIYLVTLVAYVDVPDRLQHVAVYLIAGGGTLFGTAAALSVYRDRLLAIPGRIRDREGVFGVFDWR